MSRVLVRSCPVCQSASSQPWLEKQDLALVRCRQCSMVYANPVPETFATGEYYNREGADYYLSPAKLESDYAPVRFEREVKLFREFCPRGRVLDVGCGSGAFLFQLRERFAGDYEILGTDVSGAPLDYAESRGVPVVRGDFLQQSFGEKKFDAITFWAVLEHLFDPKAFIAKAAGALKPGGACFALVPNLKSLAVRLIGKRYRYIYPQHLNYFTARTFSELAQPELSVRAIRYSHFNPVVIWQDWKRDGAEVSNTERGDLLKKTTAMKQSDSLVPLKLGYKLCESVLSSSGLADNVALVMRKT